MGRPLYRTREDFLVVDGDALFVAPLARGLSTLGTVVAVASVADAMAARPPDGRWTAVFVDVYLPDGLGFAVLDALRARGDDAFMFVMSCDASAAIINRVFDADRVEIVAKPIAPERIERCVAKAKAKAPLEERLSHVVRAWQERNGLTPREAHVVRDVLSGLTREEIAVAHGIAEGTVKKHIQNALQKLGTPTQRAMLRRAIDEVM